MKNNTFDMVEIKKPRTVILFESQLKAIQNFANKEYDGDLSQGLRKIVRLWMDQNGKS